MREPRPVAALASLIIMTAFSAALSNPAEQASRDVVAHFAKGVGDLEPLLGVTRDQKLKEDHSKLAASAKDLAANPGKATPDLMKEHFEALKKARGSLMREVNFDPEPDNNADQAAFRAFAGRAASRPPAVAAVGAAPSVVAAARPAQPAVADTGRPLFDGSQQTGDVLSDASAGRRPDAEADRAARAILARLSPAEKIQQIMIAGCRGGQSPGAGCIAMNQHLAAYKDGTPLQSDEDARTVAGYRMRMRVGADLEGGIVDRAAKAGMPPTPAASELAGKSKAEIEAIARRTVRQAHRLGVHEIYAPVLDLKTQGEGQDKEYGAFERNKGLTEDQIRRENSRRIADNPQQVVSVLRTFLRAGKDEASKIQAELRRSTGRQDVRYDVAFFAKHFPGETGIDSDVADITEKATRQALQARINMFRTLADERLIDGVMISANRFTAYGPGPGFTERGLVAQVPQGIMITSDDLSIPRRLQRREDLTVMARQTFEARGHFVMAVDNGSASRIQRDLAAYIGSDPARQQELDRRVLDILRYKYRLGLIHKV
ncbi:MAG: hypothetical protein HY078_00050 [Elusimicrobia bacterium]|nr:hypothetical protein [Elusimicrobiota bacterium]